MEAEARSLVPWIYNNPRVDYSKLSTLQLPLCGTTLHVHQDTSVDITAQKNTAYKVWDGSFLLAKHLENDTYFSRGYFTGRKCVELGAGCGLVGMAAGLLGGHVTITDLEECLAHTKKCVELNVGVLPGHRGGDQDLPNEEASGADASIPIGSDYEQSIPSSGDTVSAGLVHNHGQTSRTDTTIPAGLDHEQSQSSIGTSTGDTVPVWLDDKQCQQLAAATVPAGIDDELCQESADVSVLPQRNREISHQALLTSSSYTISEQRTAIPSSCDTLRRQCRSDLGSISVTPHAWGTEPTSLDPPYDIIMASDVVYQPSLLDPLIRSFRSLSHDRTLIILSYKARGLGEDVFFRKISAKGYSWNTIPKHDHPKEFCLSEYDLYHITKRDSVNKLS